MTLKDIKKAIKEIEAISWDDEAAHGREDDLYHNFIMHVANCDNKYLAKMATEVLNTKNIEFARWRA